MPTYGYRCESCGHEFEVLQKISDAPLDTCPKCSGKLRKKVYATGVIFKGSGFYKTDYSKSGSSDAGSSSSNGSSESGGGEKSGAEKSSSEKSGEGAKPAAESKAESKPSKSDSSD